MKTREIADLLSGTLVGNDDVEITRVAAIDSASEYEIAFLDKPLEFVSGASAVLVPLEFDQTASCTIIKVADPKLEFARIASILHPRRFGPYLRHETAVIAESADVRAEVVGAFVSIGDDTSVSKGCHIYDGSRIGCNVKIGNSTIIHANCVIYDNVEIGSNCVIHAGAVIGADGFGYVPDESGNYHQFPQIGTVIIEDNVEIGANSCVDRGALGETRIGEGTKIDNLVQIAHNVHIGKRVVIASQSGISGSTVIEDDCVIGGQVGMGDHARVQSGAIIGSQAGVLPGKIVRPGVWWGTPVQPLDEFKRQNAQLKGIGRMKEEVRTMRERLAKLEEQDQEK
jgi:UDP-3-O-[3-hydroxymyristoyl] glucosamine N-acyltransferase